MLTTRLFDDFRDTGKSSDVFFIRTEEKEQMVKFEKCIAAVNESRRETFDQFGRKTR